MIVIKLVDQKIKIYKYMKYLIDNLP